MKKGDVGMAKRFSIVRKQGMSFNYLQSYVKMPVSAWCYIPTSLPQEQAAKISMVSEAKYLVLCTVEKCVANICIWLTMPPWRKSTTLDG